MIDKNTGIIPTRVGTRYKQTAGMLSYGDHPHACGDKVIFSSSVHIFLGSSPRVWGQVQYHPSLITQLRIIPTRVGTSYCHGAGQIFNEDHPHACGDKLALQKALQTP